MMINLIKIKVQGRKRGASDIIIIKYMSTRTMRRLFIFRGILLVGILPRNILLRGIFLRRDFAGRNFSLEGFCERNFPKEGFLAGGIYHPSRNIEVC